jgi:hypothetical protein
LSTKKTLHARLFQILIFSILFVPVLSAVEDVTGDVTLEWNDNSNNETGFRIEYRINNGPWTILGSVGSNVTTYGPFSFVPPDIYSFRVYAYNSSGNSEPTNIVEVTFSDDNNETPQIFAIHHNTDNTALLEWTTVGSATGYNVYRGTVINFTPDQSGGSNRIAENIQDADASNSGVQWTDHNAGVGSCNVNYFYKVTALIGSTETSSENSNVVGDFDFQLITTPTTDFNEIALPLETPGINTAQDLMNAIPGCNSVAKWNAATQSYQQYVPGLPPTNFSVESGYSYYVNVTANTIFSLTGAECCVAYSLMTTSTTDFNEIVLPLSRTNLTKASQLMSDIPNCNSVAYWNAATQSYQQYVPGIPPTDFDLIPGYPYYVNVTSDINWPDGGLSKTGGNLADSKKINSHNSITNAPHSVFGQIANLNGSELQLAAYITTRPNEVLTQNSPGCELSSNYWMIQCASFESQWTAGEILKVVISGNQIHLETEVTLSYDPFDQASTLTAVDEIAQIPAEFKLNQNYPNPFNPLTTIPYQVSKASDVHIVIFNSMGQEVIELVRGFQSPGYYQVVWDGKDSQNNKVSSGTYLIQMQTDGYARTRKMTLLQ